MDEKRLVYFVRPRTVTDFRATYEQVAAQGIRDVVLAPKLGDVELREESASPRVREILSRLGLTAPACHGLFGAGLDFNHPDEAGREELLTAHRTCMAAMRACGCETYVVHIGVRPPGRPDAFLWYRVRTTLDALLPCAETLGIVIALENALPGNLGDDPAAIMQVVRDYDSPAVGVCLDTGHAHCCGCLDGAIEAMSPRAVTVHVHDNDGRSDLHLAPGGGTIPWPEVAPKLRRMPLLRHIETEAFNSEGWTYGQAWRHYRRALFPELEGTPAT